MDVDLCARVHVCVQCHADAIEWARERCEGQESCSLSPNHQEQLGDPCYGVHKMCVTPGGVLLVGRLSVTLPSHRFKIMAKCKSVEQSSPLDHVWKMGIIGFTIIILAIAFKLFF